MKPPRIDIDALITQLQEKRQMVIPFPNYNLVVRRNRVSEDDLTWVYGKEGTDAPTHPIPNCNIFSPIGVILNNLFLELLFGGDKEFVTTDEYHWSRIRPYKPDMIRIELGDYTRAGGDVICDICGCPYQDHSPVVGYVWLTRLCDGRLVKL